MKISVKQYNYWIIILLLAVLPIDMLNGVLLHNNIQGILSISQIYKFFVLFLIFVRLWFLPNPIWILGGVFFFLISGTLMQGLIAQPDNKVILDDIIKVSKYLTPLIAFFFFKQLFQQQDSWLTGKAFRWVYFSYGILAFNLLLKLIGVGYPMYSDGSIGTRGFFHAGNEISALLLILSSIIGYRIWVFENNKLKFILFFCFNVLLGVLISSKTGIAGIFIVFLLIMTELGKVRISLKKVKAAAITLVVVLPLLVYGAYYMVIHSPLMTRLTFFWQKMDFTTFILSSRNLYLRRMKRIYQEEFTLLQKLIGGGQTFYEEKLGHIIEIDIVDIFFGYGYLGMFWFIVLLSLLIYQARKLMRTGINPYARLTFFMSILLIIISSLSGHIFNSGIAGIFLGFLFAMMFIKKQANV